MNALTAFDNDSMALPAHLQATFAGMTNTELSTGVSGGYPVLSYKGKSWALNHNGTREVLMRPGTDDEPATHLEIVIIKANGALSKVYYEGGYVDGSIDKPDCYSNDGIAPGLDAAKPQCKSCGACPHNIFGSRISENGGKGKACSDSRRVAIVSAGNLDQPMLLRVPAATLKDLAQYAETLTRRNAPYAAVVTKIGFDPNEAYPKFTFKPLRWLTAEEAKVVSATMKSDVVTQILGSPGSFVAQAASPVASIAAPVEETPKAEKAPKASKAPKAPKAEVAAKPAIKLATPSFSAAAAPAAAAPAKSKAAEMLTDANEELDALLASMDD